MQISRHWRLNPQRYRLEGYRTSDGRLSIQARQLIVAQLEAELTSEASVARKNSARMLPSVA
ncbi:MAG: hypothetical protein ACUVSX_01045 [Aggregatilineales bacterium]